MFQEGRRACWNRRLIVLREEDIAASPSGIRHKKETLKSKSQQRVIPEVCSDVRRIL